MTKEKTVAQLFGERLERARGRSGMSNQLVASRANISVRTWNNYKAGTREPDLATLVRLCTIMRTTPSFLLGFEENNDKIGLIAEAAVASLERQNVPLTPANVKMATDALARVRERQKDESLEQAAESTVHMLLDALQEDRLGA